MAENATIDAVGPVLQREDTCPRSIAGAAALEDLRESGDYEKIASLLGGSWRNDPEFEEDAVRLRLLASGAGRPQRPARRNGIGARSLSGGRGSRAVLNGGAHSADDCAFNYRKSEPTEALRLAGLAKTIAIVRDDDLTKGEAVQLQGQALWSLERWDEAAKCFEEAIEIYAAGSRGYWLGVAYLCLGAVRNRMGTVERRERPRTRHQDTAQEPRRVQPGRRQVNVALALNALGEHDTALKYLLFAHETFEQIGHDQYTYLTLNSISATLVLLKDYSRAETYVARAIETGVRVKHADRLNV